MEPNQAKPAATSLREGPASFILSAVSGFVDTAGFILLAGIFTSHVTGNLVLAGAAVAGRIDGGVWVRLALLAVFMVAVTASSALATWANRCLSDGEGEKRQDAASTPAEGHQKILSVVPLLLFAETVLLGAFLITGLALNDIHQPLSSFSLFAIATPAVGAMGIQNALMREGLKTYLPTTMMTGNTTQFTLDGLALLRGLKTPDTRLRFRRTAIVLAGFLIGAALGAFSASFLRMWSPAVPMLAVGFLAAYAAHTPKSKGVGNA